MDTLIKNMEIPKSCYSETYSEQGNCWFFFYDFKGGCHCSISDCKCLKTKRPKGCPLGEVPPHGRLVDIDRMIRDSKKDKIALSITDTEELADFLEIYADLDKTDHTIVIEASNE